MSESASNPVVKCFYWCSRSPSNLTSQPCLRLHKVWNKILASTTNGFKQLLQWIKYLGWGFQYETFGSYLDGKDFTNVIKIKFWNSVILFNVLADLSSWILVDSLSLSLSHSYLFFRNCPPFMEVKAFLFHHFW